MVNRYVLLIQIAVMIHIAVVQGLCPYLTWVLQPRGATHKKGFSWNMARNSEVARLEISKITSLHWKCAKNFAHDMQMFGYIQRKVGVSQNVPK